MTSASERIVIIIELESPSTGSSRSTLVVPVSLRLPAVNGIGRDWTAELVISHFLI